MEKVIKSAKVLHVIFMVVLSAAILGFIIFLVDLYKNQLTLLLENPDADSVKVSNIEIGYHEFCFVQEQSISKTIITKKIVFDVLIEVLLLAMNLFLTCSFIKLLKPMTHGQPYNGTISKALKKLGVACIVMGILRNIIWHLQDVSACFTLNEIKWIFSSAVVKETVIHASYNLGLIYIGVMILLFSLVFRYGEELQVQADETL